ncbi:MAG: hypothetical protein L6Q77_00280 [Bacteroidetes bacterium]|nr:hypothetical protein [Bacteroidota bacterium]
MIQFSLIKTLVTGRLILLKNQILGKKRFGTLLLIVVMMAIWSLLLVSSLSAGNVLRELQKQDPVLIWGGIFGFSSFLAILLPIRSAKIGKTGLGRFRFLPVSDADLYLLDWIDRILQPQTLIISLFLLIFGLSWFRTSEYPAALPQILIWILFLMILIRLVSALMFRLKQQKWFFRQASILVFFLLYFLFLQISRSEAGSSVIESLNRYWISGLAAENLVSPHLTGSLILLVIAVAGLWADNRLFLWMERSEETVSDPDQTQSGKLRLILNPWWAAVRRHPTFGILILIGPFMGFLTGSVRFSEDPAADLFVPDGKMLWLVIGTTFWFYALGVLGTFAWPHLTIRNQTRDLIRQLKTAITVSLLFYLIILAGYDGLRLFSSRFFTIWLAKTGFSLALSFIYMDCLLILNGWLIIRMPVKGGIRGPSSQRFLLAIIIMAGVMIAMVGTELIAGWLSASPDAPVIILTGSLFILVLSSFSPDLIARIWESRKEKMVHLLKEEA